MIPPLLGFYAKLFIISSLVNTANFYLALLVIICSVISCLRYLNVIQISNMKMSNTLNINKSIIDIKSYIIALGTGIIT